jgi:hypothetical protein
MEKSMKIRMSVLSAVIAISCYVLPVFSQSTSAQTLEISYPSRDVEVPATIVIPDACAKESCPLVVLVHGHGGSRQENIGFPAIAAGLAEKNIASIRMDFPGCGDSLESFQANTLTNMKLDVINAIDFAIANYPVNPAQVGIFGYSMGGRIALELLAEKSGNFKSVAFLAPAASTENLKAMFGGNEGWQNLKAEAEKNGFVVYTSIFGQVQELSKEWFADLEAYANPAEGAANAYQGKSLVIYAVDDAAVAPEVSQNVADLFGSEIVVTSEDGHSYGFYSDKTEILDSVVSSAADFFDKNLR